MQVLRDKASCRVFCEAARASGRTLALVPTMGYLHAGHLSLVASACLHGATCVVVSIYVNPTQFGPSEDLAVYPRDPEGDHAKCAAAGVDAVFEPATLYDAEPAHETWVTVENMQQGLCGASRPTHFRGVATVVCKLFNIVQPHIAVFGLKDFQQFSLLRRMVRDLDLPVKMVGAPLCREPDGLALSSRNVRLTPEQRVKALCISAALRDAEARVAASEQDAKKLEAGVFDAIAAAGGVVDYVSLRDRDTLQPIAKLNVPGVMLVAATFGSVRLLDNTELVSRVCC